MRATKLAPGRTVRARRQRGAVLAALLAIVAGEASAQGYYNVELLGRFSHNREAYAAVWGYTAPDGTELAIIGSASGTSFIDATDPRRPVEVAFVDGPPSRWREMQTHSHYAYIVNETGGGMQIVDLVDPQLPVLVAEFDSTFTTGHTIHIRDGFAYVNGTSSGLRILDLAEPTRPREVGSWNARYTHDCFVRGNLLYACNIQQGGFTVLNIADKRNPVELSFTQYAGAATHNAWTTEDGRYLLTTDETSGGRLRVWDVADPRHPSYVTEWAATGGIVHNVVVRGDSAYIAYYTEGLQVLDVSDPRSPLLVGSYDTFPGTAEGYFGNWGVYPFAANRSIYLSDIDGGLFVVRMGSGGQPALDFFVTPPAGQVASPGQQQVLFFFDVYNGAGSTRTFDLLATTNTGWQVSAPATLTVPRSGTEPVLVRVTVPQSLAEAQRVDVQLCVRSQATRLASCKQTRLAVPVTLQDFTATAGEGVVSLQWRLEFDGVESGTLILLRAADGGVYDEHARLTLEVRAFQDAEVEPGRSYRYALGLESPAGFRILGEASVATRAAHGRLTGAWPNPFSEATAVRFELARPGDVRLAVYDVRGRLVRVLDHRGLRAGAHAIEWDGRDGRGTRAPAGVYLYEIASPGLHARGRVTRAE